MQRFTFSLFVIILVFFSMKIAFCQPTIQINTESRFIPIGINKITKEKIMAHEISFPFYVYNFFIDTTETLATVQIRKANKKKNIYKNPGELLVYNLEQDSLMWNRTILYDKSLVTQYENTLILNYAQISVCLKLENGVDIWKKNKSVFLIEPKHNLAFGYNNSSLSSNMLEGIDIEDGSTKWSREIIRKYGWNDYTYLNDNTLLVVASGLHTINLNNGTGWDYTKKTGERKYGSTIITNIIGMSLGVLTGVYTYNLGSNIHGDINSNVLIEDNHAFYASKEELAKIDLNNGETFWCNQFSKDTISTSSLQKIGDTLYFINSGFGFDFGRNTPIYYGSPFFACYRATDGKLLFRKPLEQKEKVILDYKIDNNRITILHPDRLIEYSFNDSSKNNEKFVLSNSEDKLISFLDNKFYYQTNDSLYLPINSLFPLSNNVVTKQEEYLSINSNNDTIVKLSSERVFYNVFMYGDYKIITSTDKTLIINKKDKVVAILNVPCYGKFLGNKLYLGYKERFLVIDLSQI